MRQQFYDLAAASPIATETLSRIAVLLPDRGRYTRASGRGATGGPSGAKTAGGRSAGAVAAGEARPPEP